MNTCCPEFSQAGVHGFQARGLCPRPGNIVFEFADSPNKPETVSNPLPRVKVFRDLYEWAAGRDAMGRDEAIDHNRARTSADAAQPRSCAKPARASVKRCEFVSGMRMRSR